MDRARLILNPARLRTMQHLKLRRRACTAELVEHLTGVSLGGQIVLELLFRKLELAEKAIVDGGVCYPRPAMARFRLAAAGLCWGLMFSERACRFQLAAMPKILPVKMLCPEELREHYLRDMPSSERRRFLRFTAPVWRITP